MMPAIPPDHLALGALFALGMALGGYATGALSRSGAVGAVAVGTMVFAFGGPSWAVLVVVFFVASSLLSAWRAADKASAAVVPAKGARRDLAQVLANGGVAALVALAHAVWPEWDAFPAFVGALAAVTADTWATEVGLLSAVPPRLITTGRSVPRGTSGGVTVLGTSAAVLGGMAIGVAAALVVAVGDLIVFGTPDPALLDLTGIRFLLIAPVAGVAASACDSWLGATVQAVYRDAASGRPTERPAGDDGRPNPLARGWAWMTNDAVNAAASLAGAAVAVALAGLLSG